MGELTPGDRAPEFQLSDQQGRTVRLSDFRGRRVLLYFYPKADTPGCIQQSCAVRDARRELAALGVDVVGISPDPSERQRRFDAKYGLGFPLLADPDHRMCEAFGAWGERKMYGRSSVGVIRSSFLVDEEGRIEALWYRVSPKDTVPRALEVLGHRESAREPPS